MAISANFNEQRDREIALQIDSLATAVKGYKWKITRENLGTCSVQNQLHLATFFVLSTLFVQIHGQNDPTLKRLKKKIIGASEVIEALSVPSLDPRLATLVNTKIPKLTFKSLHKNTKIEAYSELLKNLAGSDPQISHRQMVHAQMQLMRGSLASECSKPELPLSMECPSPMVSLQEAIVALSLHSPEGFSKALDGILELDGLTFAPHAENKDKKITNRIFFHLQNIHKKETPEKVNSNDRHYGSNAFLSQNMSTSAEKLRAVQRTQVEVCLFTLKECLKGDLSIDSPIAGKTAFAGIFEILENLKLDPKDLPKGQKNLAHALFGKLYSTYLAAWEKDKSMIHPHDKTFKNDFGRNAFLYDSKGVIPDTYRMQAVVEMSQVLKEGWDL